MTLISWTYKKTEKNWSVTVLRHRKIWSMIVSE